MEHKIKYKVTTKKVIVGIRLEFTAEELSKIVNSSDDQQFITEEAFKRFKSLDNYDGHVSSFCQHMALFAHESSLLLYKDVKAQATTIVKRVKKKKQRRSLTGVI